MSFVPFRFSHFPTSTQPPTLTLHEGSEYNRFCFHLGNFFAYILNSTTMSQADTSDSSHSHLS